MLLQWRGKIRLPAKLEGAAVEYYCNNRCEAMRADSTASQKKANGGRMLLQEASESVRADLTAHEPTVGSGEILPRRLRGSKAGSSDCRCLTARRLRIGAGAVGSVCPQKW